MNRRCLEEALNDDKVQTEALGSAQAKSAKHLHAGRRRVTILRARKLGLTSDANDLQEKSSNAALYHAAHCKIIH